MSQEVICELCGGIAKEGGGLCNECYKFVNEDLFPVVDKQYDGKM